MHKHNSDQHQPFIAFSRCKGNTGEKSVMERVLVALNLQRMITLFMEYCRSKQLRPKTMASYEQTLKLFARWLWERYDIENADEVKEPHIRSYIIDLQNRGKYYSTMEPYEWTHSFKLSEPPLEAGVFVTQPRGRTAESAVRPP